MSISYYCLKQSSNEYIYLGTGSYYDCHEDLIDILIKCKKNETPIRDVQEETMRLYDEYSGERPLSNNALRHSWYYKKFIPAVYNWVDNTCILLCDYDLNNYAKNYLIKNGNLKEEDIKNKSIISSQDYTSQCLKEVGSMWEDENKEDSIIDRGFTFTMAWNELLKGNTVYRKSILPEIDFRMEDNKLYWFYSNYDKQEKHYLNVIGIDNLFANDWLIKEC